MALASKIEYLTPTQICWYFAFRQWIQTLAEKVTSYVTIGTSLTFSSRVIAGYPMLVFFKLNNVEYNAFGMFVGTHKLSYSFSDTVRFEFDGSTKTLSMYTNGVQTDMSTVTDLEIWTNGGNGGPFS